MSIAEIRSGFQAFLTKMRIWLEKIAACDYMALIKQYRFPIVIIFSIILGIMTSLDYSIIALLVASLPMIADCIF